MDKATVFGINGNREMYSVMLFNPVSRQVQVPGPKLNRFFGYSGVLTDEQVSLLPLSCIETVSLGKETPGWLAYTARPAENGVEIQAPYLDYKVYIATITDCDQLRDYLEIAISSPLYLPEVKGDDEDEQVPA